MIPKANYHTHTKYCDGKNTVAEMTKAAFDKGFTHLGFSGHGYTDFDESYCMSRENIQNYLRDVAAVKAEYAGKMEVYTGVEQDCFSTESTDIYDYIIGSTHYVYKDGLYHTVDESEEKTNAIVREFFGGDFLKYAAAYFEAEVQVVAKTKPDIIGHFDLISKFNEGNKYFNMDEKAYGFLALEAMEELLRTGVPFEINTGAMYRGLRTEPYPSYGLLKELQKRGGEIVLSSDSHDCNSIGFAFGEVAGLSGVWFPLYQNLDAGRHEGNSFIKDKIEKHKISL